MMTEEWCQIIFHLEGFALFTLCHSHIQRRKFGLEILQECKESELLELEQTYLDKNPEYNIGIHSSGGDNLSKNPNRDKIIENITKAVQDRYLKMTDQERIDKYEKLLDKNSKWKGGISISYCKTCNTRIVGGAIYCRDHVIYDRAKEKNAFYGKTHSEEVKKSISEKNKGKKPNNMKQVIIDNIIYESLTEATRQTGIPSPTILWRINSKNKKFENYQSHPAIKAPLSN
jgi:hypothetical protein